MSDIRKIVQSPLQQGQDEIVAYTLTTTPWGSSPSSPTVKLYSVGSDGSTLTDVSATLLSGSPSVASDVITTPLVTSLVAGTSYRLEIKFVISGNTFEAYTIIEAEV